MCSARPPLDSVQLGRLLWPRSQALLHSTQRPQQHPIRIPATPAREYGYTHPARTSAARRPRLSCRQSTASTARPLCSKQPHSTPRVGSAPTVAAGRRRRRGSPVGALLPQASSARPGGRSNLLTWRAYLALYLSFFRLFFTLCLFIFFFYEPGSRGRGGGRAPQGQIQGRGSVSLDAAWGGPSTCACGGW